MNIFSFQYKEVSYLKIPLYLKLSKYCIFQLLHNPKYIHLDLSTYTSINLCGGRNKCFPLITLLYPMDTFPLL